MAVHRDRRDEGGRGRCDAFAASGEQYAGLQAALKSVGPNVRLTEGTYVVDTDHSPSTVYQSLLRHIYKNDRLLVLRVSRPYFGQHSSDVVEWLNARL